MNDVQIVMLLFHGKALRRACWSTTWRPVIRWNGSSTTFRRSPASRRLQPWRSPETCWPRVRILLDESLPRPMSRLLVGHDVSTVAQQEWASLSNGALLRQAAETFDVRC